MCINLRLSLLSLSLLNVSVLSFDNGSSGHGFDLFLDPDIFSDKEIDNVNKYLYDVSKEIETNIKILLQNDPEVHLIIFTSILYKKIKF